MGILHSENGWKPRTLGKPTSSSCSGLLSCLQDGSSWPYTAWSSCSQNSPPPCSEEPVSPAPLPVWWPGFGPASATEQKSLGAAVTSAQLLPVVTVLLSVEPRSGQGGIRQLGPGALQLPPLPCSTRPCWTPVRTTFNRQLKIITCVRHWDNDS